MTVLTAVVAGALYPWDNLGKSGKFQDCVTQSRYGVNSKIAWNIITSKHKTFTAGGLYPRDNLGKAGIFQHCIKQSRDCVNTKIAWNIYFAEY